jgi:hypothetical protein
MILFRLTQLSYLLIVYPTRELLVINRLGNRVSSLEIIFETRQKPEITSNFLHNSGDRRD